MSLEAFPSDLAFPQLKIASDPELMREIFRRHLRPFVRAAVVPFRLLRLDWPGESEHLVWLPAQPLQEYLRCGRSVLSSSPRRLLVTTRKAFVWGWSRPFCRRLPGDVRPIYAQDQALDPLRSGDQECKRHSQQDRWEKEEENYDMG